MALLNNRIRCELLRSIRMLKTFDQYGWERTMHVAVTATDAWDISENRFSLLEESQLLGFGVTAIGRHKSEKNTIHSSMC